MTEDLLRKRDDLLKKAWKSGIADNIKEETSLNQPIIEQVAILPVVSMVPEKVVTGQLMEHLNHLTQSLALENTL